MPPVRKAWRAELRLPVFDAAAAFEALAPQGETGFLIERGSFDGEPRTAVLGARPSAAFRLRGGELRAQGAAPAAGGGALDALGRALEKACRGSEGPAWAGGAVGFLAYEAARHVEPVPGRAELDEEAVFYRFDEALLHDYASGRTEYVAWCPGGAGFGAAARRAEARAGALERKLRSVCAARPARGRALRLPLPAGALGRARFLSAVRRIREHIAAGDIFQCVLSDQFRVATRARALDVYLALREINPSPYHFLLQESGGRTVLGASPERLVRVEDGRVLYSPIAGTRPRGRTSAEDRRREATLRRSVKERAEHLMLVDLGRNDLGRVCAPGTVEVRRYMDVHRFSSVMHLVSEIEGRLDAGRTPWDALVAAFPAGTVTGAPKVRAMQILAGLEPRARGFYSGAFVQLDPLGNLDSCISLRSMQLHGGTATLQAGAGIVADSNPAREWDEVINKLEAGRRALAAAEPR